LANPRWSRTDRDAEPSSFCVAHGSIPPKGLLPDVTWIAVASSNLASTGLAITHTGAAIVALRMRQTSPIAPDTSTVAIFERRPAQSCEAPDLVERGGGARDDMKFVEGDARLGQVVGGDAQEGWQHVEVHRGDLLGPRIMRGPSARRNSRWSWGRAPRSRTPDQRFCSERRIPPVGPVNEVTMLTATSSHGSVRERAPSRSYISALAAL